MTFEYGKKEGEKQDKIEIKLIVDVNQMGRDISLSYHYLLLCVVLCCVVVLLCVREKEGKDQASLSIQISNPHYCCCRLVFSTQQLQTYA